ncbi:RHS repeat domain-containing protein, partial [Streptomyces flavochromogenes]|uniref:RHS repeat domain-containing protein n=1 Tax=Streptomyces flavochromogenes TaxID=68199 RepID=UPI0004BEE48A
LPSVTQTGADPRTETYTYDAAGNTETRKIGNADLQNLAWDDEGRLKSVTTAAGATGYLYDTTGQRLIRRDSTGTTLYLPGGNELHKDKAGKVTGTRYYGGGTAMYKGGKLTFLLADHHGTGTTQISNDAGQAITRRKTTLFGGPRGTQPTKWIGDKGFVGGTNEADTGLVHIGAREYDPATGRFVSVDPILEADKPQTMNGYGYAANNPFSFADPTGEALEECVNGMYVCKNKGTDIVKKGKNYDKVVDQNRRNSTVFKQNYDNYIRSSELGRRARAAYRSGAGGDASLHLNPTAPQIVAMFFMGSAPDAYSFDESDQFTAGVKDHIWMDVVRRFLTSRKGLKSGQVIKGLDYTTRAGAKMNGEDELKVMMVGELADFVTYLSGSKDPAAREGATRAILGSFNLQATVSDYQPLTRTGKVEYELTQTMSEESFTRGVSDEGYESGAKEPGAAAAADAIRKVFPNGMRDVHFTVRWSERLPMQPLGE